MVTPSSFINNLRATGARTRGESNEDDLGYERHIIHPWEPHGWRTLAKLAVRPVSKWGGVELGLYELGSHDVVGIPECRVHHPSVNLAIDILQKAAKKVNFRMLCVAPVSSQLWKAVWLLFVRPTTCWWRVRLLLSDITNDDWCAFILIRRS